MRNPERPSSPRDRPAAPWSPDSKRRLILALIALLIAAYGVALASSQFALQLWDESRQAVNAAEMRQTGLSLVTTFGFRPDLWNTKPPLFIWAVLGCFRLLGTSVFALRLPSTLASVATVAIVARFCWTTTRRPLLALVAALLLIASPRFFGIHVGLTADYDAMLTLWVTLVTTSFFRAVHASGRRGRLDWAVCGLALGAAVLTKGIAGLLVTPGLFLYAFAVRRGGKVFRSPGFWLAAATALAIIVGFYALRERAAPGYLNAVVGNEITNRYANANETHNGPPWFYLVSLAKGNFSLGPLFLLAPFLLRWAAPRVRLVGLFAAIAGLTLFVVYSVAATKIFWYIAPTFPLLSILSASAIDGVVTRFSGSPRATRTATLAAGLVVAGAVIHGLPQLFVFLKPSIRMRPGVWDDDYGYFFDRIEALPVTRIVYVDSRQYSPIGRFFALVRVKPGGSIVQIANLGDLAKFHPQLIATCDPSFLQTVARLGTVVESTPRWTIVRTTEP